MLRSVVGVALTSLLLFFVAVVAGSACTTGGESATECAPGFDACDSESETCSTDLSTTAAHCGACGNACPGNPNARPACRDRTCVNACNQGFGDCDGEIENGCETPTAADPNNCGACGKTCPSGAECSGGVCRAICNDPARGDCNGSVEDGCETVLAVTKDHCGACDKPCAGGLVCADATCVTATSCRSLAGHEPPLPNGHYRIDPDSEGPEPAYDSFCLLDSSADGGGWALAAKVDGAKATFEYGADIWTSPTTVNASALALDFSEAKLAAFFRVPALEARIGLREGNQATRWIVVDGPAKIEGSSITLQDAFLNGALYPTTEGREAWVPLIDGSDLEPGCNREGWNVKVGTFAVRVGIVSTASDCGVSGTSFLGVGSRRLEAIAGSSKAESRDRPVMAYILVR